MLRKDIYLVILFYLWLNPYIIIPSSYYI
jgi:hypothetical protein